ncbi:hypothetical protein BDV96DRAFT_297428 [Lophiotrema nucula]|uniref:Uncharacterized protein n=1 Tax=Lophiotrema nucula TaxID=690887 RepID=A0A6A5YLI6_9PLEO|nr:hypothetical protein BDV96DRAFT_297428 [Lophiotrema nucula]
MAPEQSKHAGDASLHVSYTEEQVAGLAREVYNGTIADVHLSLFVSWICDKSSNFEVAKECVRELDQVRVSLLMFGYHILKQLKGYQGSRVENPALNTLLELTEPARQRVPSFISQLPTASKTLMRVRTLDGKRGDSTNPISKMSRAFTTASTINHRGSPPNTPDRPAPLSFTPRSSDNGPPSAQLRRTVSTPVRRLENPFLTPLTPEQAEDDLKLLLDIDEDDVELGGGEVEVCIPM